MDTKILTLRMYFQQAFHTRMMRDERGEISKRRPIADLAVGLEAATKYRGKHPGFNRVGSLKKVSRALRIEAGLRPFKFDVMGKRERKVMRRMQQRGL